MKTRRKLRQRRLALPFGEPVNPVDHERGRELLARMRETLAQQFAEKSKCTR